MFVLLLVVVPLVLSSCPSCTDLTLIAGSSGSSVVLATVRLIDKSGIFVNDYQTLRRIAYVETGDGTSQSTYRQGFNGGIWAINETAFNSINFNNT